MRVLIIILALLPIKSYASCSGMASLAELVMIARQKGVEVDVLREKSINYGSIRYVTLVEKISSRAYKLPLEPVRANKLKAVNAFKRRIFMECISKEKAVRI